MAQIPDDPALLPLLRSIAEALERLAPPPPASAALDGADAFVWHAEGEWLEPVSAVNRVDLELLQGLDRSRDILLDNTRRFARACRPTTPCCGGRAAPARARWSRPLMRR